MADAGSFNADLGINMQFNVDGAGLVEMSKTIKEISKGKDLQKYWKDVESATNSAAKIAKRYKNNIDSETFAQEFLKQINALKALTNDENLSNIFPNVDIDFDSLITAAKEVVPKINSEFSVDKFAQAFKTFDLLKDRGIELKDAFDKLSNYEKLDSKYSSLANENYDLRNLFGDMDFEEVKRGLNEIQSLRSQAEETFDNFLKLNNIDRRDIFGDEQFSEYFEEIRNGSMTAADAISKFKNEYTYLLEEGFRSNNDTFGLDQLQAFSNKLDSIFVQVEETSQKISTILSDGVITKTVQDLSPDLAGMEQVGNVAEEAIQAKKEFANANDGVQNSVDESKSPLQLEADLMDQIAKSAHNAADAKKEFVEANKQVKESADESNASTEKDRYANRSKISENDFLNNSNKYSTIANEKLNASGYNILGNAVSTDLINGLVKVTAKIKDADGVWKTFSAKIDADGNMFEQRFRTITKGINKLDAELSNFGKDEIKIPTTDEQIQKFKELSNAIDDYIAIRKRIASGKAYTNDKEEADKLLNTINEIMGKTDGSATILSTKQLAEAQDRLDKIEKTVSEINQKGIQNRIDRLSSYNTKLDGYNATIARFNDGGWTSSTYLKNVQAVKNAVHEYETLLNELKGKDASLVTSDDINRLDNYEKKIKDTIATVSNMSAAEKGYNFVSAQKELDKIHKLLNENSRMSSTAKDKIKAYYAEIESGNPSMSLDKIHGEIMKIYNAEVEAGRAGRSFLDTLKNSGFHQFAAQMAGIVSFYDIVNVGKNAITTIKDLDYELVDLEKTTKMSSNQLNEFYYDSNNVAKQMGVTTSAIIEQASSWSRLGYSTKEAATEMAQLSSQFATISPGMDTDTSQEGLVSIMKAWNIDYSDVKSEIMDNINTLGNTMAENNQDIVEGMERSAAALAAVGTSYKDAFAMFSGIQEVLQNAEVSGRALRSISMRIRGYDESTEELSSDLSNVTGELVDLTKTAEHSQGVSIFKDGSTTEFKSLVDYFGEINNIWDEMSQKQQNDFLQKAFGKTQAQAGAALIQNYSAVTKALEEMDNSFGSSDREMGIVEKSIDYKLNRLRETWVGTAQNLVDRGTIGSIIDFLNSVSEGIGFVLDKLGLVPTSIGAIGMALGSDKLEQQFCPSW